MKDILEVAGDALGDAVERYDAIGWFDPGYADASELAEAAAVEAAYKRVQAYRKGRGTDRFWIFTQRYPDWDPYVGPIFGGASADEARTLILDRWLAAGEIDRQRYDEYADTTGLDYLRIHGPFALAPSGGGDDVLQALAEINRQRTRAGHRPLEPISAGWSAQDVLDEAKRLRSPNRLRRRLAR